MTVNSLSVLIHFQVRSNALQEITTTLHKNGVIASKFLEEPDVLLPESIQANREAYAQGEWRKQAFAAR